MDGYAFVFGVVKSNDFTLVARVRVVGYFYGFIQVTFIQASFFTGTME